MPNLIDDKSTKPKLEINQTRDGTKKKFEKQKYLARVQFLPLNKIHQKTPQPINYEVTIECDVFSTKTRETIDVIVK